MKNEKIIFTLLTILAIGIGGWSMACLIGGLAASGWSVSALLGGWLGAVGAPATMVEYYTQIKGIEYIVCASFLALFPLYYKYVNRTKVKIKA